jgi:hypothetical protein
MHDDMPAGGASDDGDNDSDDDGGDDSIGDDLDMDSDTPADPASKPLLLSTQHSVPSPLSPTSPTGSATPPKSGCIVPTSTLLQSWQASTDLCVVLPGFTTPVCPCPGPKESVISPPPQPLCHTLRRAISTLTLASRPAQQPNHMMRRSLDLDPAESSIDVTDASPPESPHHSDQANHTQPHTSSTQAVNSVTDLFDWADDAFDAISRVFGPSALQKLRNTLALTTYSTSFSGIDAPGVALNVIVNRMNKRVAAQASGTSAFPVPTPKCRHLHAIEWFGESQRELAAGEHPPECLFADIAQFFDKRINKVLDSIETSGGTLAVKALLPLILSGKGARLEGYCLTHRRQCCLQKAKLHIAGAIPYRHRSAQHQHQRI